MDQPSVASSADTLVPASETVTRPDPGLARGTWEAPAWAFGVALAVLLVGTALYVAGRLGWFTRRKPTAARARGRGRD
jgi:hypothetical protein